MKRKSRLITLIVGFFVFVIPLYFLSYSLNREYELIKNRTEENLREKLLDRVSELQEGLDPYNYLQSEFDEIHAQLLPDFPKEIIKGVPDEKYTKNLYSKELFDKLLILTKNKYTPIVATLFTENANEVFPYYSKELDKELTSTKERNVFLRAKNYFDLKLVKKIYSQNFSSNPKIIVLDKIEDFKNRKDLNFKYFTDICYKYISRFSDYGRGLKPMYTDYFRKQVVYTVIKGTYSSKAIHGFYSLLIPQSQIVPKKIVDKALERDDLDVKIQLVDKEENSSGLKEKNNQGFDYYLNLPTSLISQVYSYKRLNKIDQTDLLNKKFKVSIFYPEDLIKFKKLNSLMKYFSNIFIIIYFLTIIIVKKIHTRLKLHITRKLICLLSLIVFLPIIGIGLLTYLTARNLDSLIDYNVSKKMHNVLENYSLINKENHFRRLSSVFEMKRRISKSYFSNENLYNNIILESESKKWFGIWNSKMFVLSMNGDFYCFDNYGNIKAEKHIEEKNLKFEKFIMSKYVNNLNTSKNTKKDSKELLTLGFLEDYINPKVEEQIVAQESIHDRALLALTSTETGTYYYAKDKFNKGYFIRSKLRDNPRESFDFFNDFSDKTNTFWFRPIIKYADLSIGVMINCHDENKRTKYPRINLTNDEIEPFLNESINSGDSSKIKIINNDGSILKESIIFDHDPFSVAAVAQSYHNSFLSFNYKMIFPVLFGYTLLLLILLTEFISAFINKPVDIYEKAINELNNNNFGVTINSFSKDEFNNITMAFNEMSVAIKQKEQIKRYVSDKLVESVSENKIQEAGNGKMEKVTILSSDIRNFTGISEMHEPSAIVDMLNGYFTKMQQAISSNGGIIDKYIGDAIQAVFYDEPDNDNPVFRAAKAALQMRKALEEYNKEREESGLFTIQNGIGIDTDYAITGTIGTEKGRKDFSVNGDVIARAAELEAKTKQTQSKILLSKASLSLIKDPLSLDDACHQSQQIIFTDFDEDSVELIDVR